MDPDLDTLSRRLAALVERFTGLGAKLAEAARELQDGGAPPSDALVDELATARGEFTDLRADVLAAAESLDVAAPEHLESLKNLEPILETVQAAVAARARRAALEEARAAVLGVLERVLAVLHTDDPGFAPLVGCQGKARELREAVMALTDPQSDAAQQVANDIRPFSDFLTMIDGDQALDDERYAQLEETVSRAFGRPLAVAAARGRLLVPGRPQTAASEVVPAPAPAPEPMAESSFDLELDPHPEIEDPEPLRMEADSTPASAPVLELEREPVLELDLSAPLVDEPALATEASAPESAPAPESTSGPDETAQWWLAAWARWSGWKNSLSFADAVKEELGKYPYLLSVPIQKSAEHEDGLLAYGYSIVMEHVEKQNPGCVGNALNSLKPGETRPVGAQLYDYLVTEGKLAETYAEFVKNVLLSALPEPGVWFQNRILESKDDTRVLQRPTQRIGDPEQHGQRFAADGQRFAEHRFAATVAPLTARFFLATADIKEARGVDVRLTLDGGPSDSAWLVSIPAPGKTTRIEARRLHEGGMAMPGLGRDYSTLWIAVFNDDTTRERRYELGITLKKDAKSPFGVKARAAS